MGKTGFTRLPGSITGITFTNHLTIPQAAENVLRMNGSGVAAGDVDGDGDVDVIAGGSDGAGGGYVYIRLLRNAGGGVFTVAEGLRMPAMAVALSVCL